MERVANASDILHFKKRAADRKMADDKFDANGLSELMDGGDNITMEDLIQEYFTTQESDKKLSVLDQREFGNAVKIYIDKDDKDALKCSIDRTMERQFDALMAREDGLEVAQSMSLGGVEDMDMEDEEARRTGAARGRAAAPAHNMSDESDLSAGEEEPPVHARGRGRGRGSRGGRGRAAPVVTTSPVKRGRGARAASTAASRSSGSIQSTLAQSFAKTAPR